MSIMYSPDNEPTELEEIVVTAARRVRFTELPTYAYVEPVSPIVMQTVSPDGSGGEGENTLEVMPENFPQPANCADVAFLLNEAQDKKQTYDATRRAFDPKRWSSDCRAATIS